MAHGGARPNSGRKSFAEETGIREDLAPMSKDWLEAVLKGIKKGNPAIMRMYAEYYLGKPTENVNVKGELDILWNEIRNYGTDQETNDSSGLSGGL
jgi:hypothetical protein